MRTNNKLLRPVSLEPGAACFRIEPPVPCKDAVVLPIWFIGYDPCPAFVIVRAGDGSRQRCPRAEIYVSASPARGITEPTHSLARQAM
jgi:hypothetical protein